MAVSQNENEYPSEGNNIIFLLTLLQKLNLISVAIHQDQVLARQHAYLSPFIRRQLQCHTYLFDNLLDGPHAVELCIADRFQFKISRKCHMQIGWCAQRMHSRDNTIQFGRYHQLGCTSICSFAMRKFELQINADFVANKKSCHAMSLYARSVKIVN